MSAMPSMRVCEHRVPILDRCMDCETEVAQAARAREEAEDAEEQREQKRADEHRRGELHSALCELVEKHGIEDVRWMVGVIADDIQNAPAPARSARTAVAYECVVIVERPESLLLFIEDEANPAIGQGTWCPRSMVVQREERSVTVTAPLRWRSAKRVGERSVELGR